MTGTGTATPAQHGMWITERAGAGGLAFHMPLAVWLDGPLDAEAMRAACAAVAERHPVLASALAERDGELLLEPGAAALYTVEGSPKVAELVEREIALPFDLERGPLARFTLASPEPKRHVLLFVAHHAIFDGISKDILLRDLAAAYSGATLSPLAAPAPELPEPGAAAGFWATRWRDEWDVRLPGLSGVSMRAAPGDAVDFTLGGLGEISAQLGLTRFEALLAAFHVLLRSYGDERPAVAVDLSTRGEPTREHVGHFVNELPVFSRPQGTFAQFARELRAELRELYGYRQIPLARAVGGISPRTALTPVSMSYRRREEPGPLFAGLGASVEWMMFNGWVRNTLHLQVVDGPEGVAARLQFNPALLSRAGCESVRDDLTALLRAVAEQPEAALEQLPLPATQPPAALHAPATHAAPAAGTPAGLLGEVRAIFAQALTLDDVEADDDLFELGGHSLTITRIIAMTREQLDVELSFEVFIDDATPAGAAAEIARLLEES